MLSVLYIFLSVVINQVSARMLKIVCDTEVKRDGERTEADTNGTISIQLENKSVFPMFQVHIVLWVRNLLTGTEIEIEKFYFLLPREKKKEDIVIGSEFIGRVETDIKTAECIDAVGIDRLNVRSVSRGHFNCYPELSMMNSNLSRHKSRSQKLTEIYLNRKGNDPSEVLDIREYQRGDNVKRIHWKLSARLGHTMVRELDMPSDQDTLVVLGLEGQKSDREIDKLVKFGLNLCWNLLRQDTHHNVILLDEYGYLIQNYNISSEEDYNFFEHRVLEGGINFSAEYLDSYIENNNITGKYAQVIYVTNLERDLGNRNDDIEYIVAED